jgi:hypothetical protein
LQRVSVVLHGTQLAPAFAMPCRVVVVLMMVLVTFPAALEANSACGFFIILFGAVFTVL